MQRLIFFGKELKDQNCLSSYKIKNGSTLHMAFSQHIKVDLGMNVIISLKVLPTDTMEYVKKQLQQITSISRDHVLTLDGKVWKTIKLYLDAALGRKL